MSTRTLTRRQALAGIGTLVGGATAIHAQTSSTRDPRSVAGTPGAAARAVRLAPREELVNVPEFEAMAKLTLAPAVYAAIASGSRPEFDCITLRPRALVPTTDLDLSVSIFGYTSWAPMLIAATPTQKRFHPEGELATMKGAEAARAIMIVSSRSSVPFEQIAAQARQPLWYLVAPGDAGARAGIERAIKAGSKAVLISPGNDWPAADQLRRNVAVPVLASGIVTPQQAQQAVQRGFNGIVVSRTRGRSPMEAPIELLPPIADAVAERVPVFLEGSVQRGSDVFKAAALGARAVLVSQPAMWGLAAYGAEGVETVMSLLLVELARAMGSCGKVNIEALDRTAVRVHGRRPATAARAETA